MFEDINNDVNALRIHLNELRTKFDCSIRDGLPFELVKKIYLEIKDLECQIKVMELTTTNNVEHIKEMRRRQMDEPPQMM